MSANRSFFRTALDRLVDARMRQAEREIANHRRGGLMWNETDSKPAR